MYWMLFGTGDAGYFNLILSVAVPLSAIGLIAFVADGWTMRWTMRGRLWFGVVCGLFCEQLC